jgi:3-methyladenine DNA glycosylase/8-oxoguanine DNA glycosylase
MNSLEVELHAPRNLRAVLGPLRRGTGDPAFQIHADGMWLTGLMQGDPFTLRLVADADLVRGTYWGPARDAAANTFADLLGATDDVRGFIPQHPAIESQWRRYANVWRTPRSLLTWQVALAAVLEQRVTGVEARGAWRALLREHGTVAPGPAPAGMMVPPTAQEVLRVPSWDWRRYGVDRQRVATIREVASVSHLLAQAEHMTPAQGRALLTRLSGIGPWTAAEISAKALGDADAVSVGDYHLARNVTFALTGDVDGTDDDMLELLEVYAGHRHRVVRMIELAGIAPPRRGPRMRLPGPR